MRRDLYKVLADGLEQIFGIVFVLFLQPIDRLLKQFFELLQHLGR